MIPQQESESTLLIWDVERAQRVPQQCRGHGDYWLLEPTLRFIREASAGEIGSDAYYRVDIRVVRRVDVSGVVHDIELEVLKHIESLVSQSLLLQMDDGEPRFHMLETVREYAAVLLSRCGEQVAARQAHAAHYLDKVEAAEPHLSGPEAGIWINWLEVDHDNIRAALRWALDHGDCNTALRLSGAVWRFRHMHGHLREGSRWLDEALATREPSLPTDDRSRSASRSAALPAAKALTGSGVLGTTRATIRARRRCALRA